MFDNWANMSLQLLQNCPVNVECGLRTSAIPSWTFQLFSCTRREMGWDDQVCMIPSLIWCQRLKNRHRRRDGLVTFSLRRWLRRIGFRTAVKMERVRSPKSRLKLSSYSQKMFPIEGGPFTCQSTNFVAVITNVKDRVQTVHLAIQKHVSANQRKPVKWQVVLNDPERKKRTHLKKEWLDKLLGDQIGLST